jgi:hypothetical protein
MDDHAREMYRVLKPGARYACSEYLLTPHFDWNNEEHVTLHKTFLPTLAATHSMYPADVCAALERAGFKISPPRLRRAKPGRYASKSVIWSLWVGESLEPLRRFAFCLHGSTSRLIYFKKVAKLGRYASRSAI